MARVLNTSKHCLVGALTKCSCTLFCRNIHPLVSISLIKLACDIDNVVATIGIAAEDFVKLVHIRMRFGVNILFIFDIGFTVIEKNLSCFFGRNSARNCNVSKLHVARRNRTTKYVHLRTVIVDVVLAENLVPAKFHNIAGRIAKRCPTTMSYMQRAGRICGNKFVIDLFAFAKIGRTPSGTSFTHRLDHFIRSTCAQIEIYEARTSNFNFGHSRSLRQVRNNDLSNFCRSHPARARRSKRNRGGPIAIRRVLRTLKTEVGDLKICKFLSCLRFFDGSEYELFECFLHVLSFC